MSNETPRIMKYQELLSQSRNHLVKSSNCIHNEISINLFSIGAKWMFDKLNELDNKKSTKFDHSINYNLYGILKYGICFFALLISFFFFYKIHLFLTPLSVIVFYFFEVHFLFLFPLLIDKTKNPILMSIKQTYRIGIFQSIFTVIPIGFFMVFGLFKINNPFKNWYIGCLSIIIWYQNEVRNRI